MVTKKIIIKGVIVLLACSSAATFAQYGTGDSSIGQFLSEGSDLKQSDETHVNVPYERGKAVFLGRGDSPKLSYCVLHKGEKVKIKRSSMYSFKQTSYSVLSDKLYNCDKPDSKIISELGRNNFINVLYYLDVKYKLNLERA